MTLRQTVQQSVPTPIFILHCRCQSMQNYRLNHSLYNFYKIPQNNGLLFVGGKSGEQPSVFSYHPTISRICFQKSIPPCSSTLHVWMFQSNILQEEQNCFKDSFSIMDYYYTLFLLLEKMVKNNVRLVAFITLLSAFDFADRNHLWAKLHDHNIDPWLLMALQCPYCNIEKGTKWMGNGLSTEQITASNGTNVLLHLLFHRNPKPFVTFFDNLYTWTPVLASFCMLMT